MGSKPFTIALLCVILYSLRADAATHVGSRPPSSRMGMVEEPTSTSLSAEREPSLYSEMSSSSERPFSTTLQASTQEDQSVAPTVFTDPFLLIGEDNVFGPPTRRRKVIRRTRRRRIKKLKSKSTTESSQSGDVSFSMGGSSTSTSTSTENVLKSAAGPGNMGTTTMKLEVIPIDSDQSITEEMSASLPSPTPHPSPAPKLPDPIFKSGHYTRHQRNRKKATPKANLWRSPNFSMELFDTDSTMEEERNNVDKRESSNNNSNKNRTRNSYNMFTSKPTSLSYIPEMSADESTNPYVNTSLPISTELQNSLQFSLQVLHPLLNSDSVLSENQPKIPEDKTVAVTHSLSSTVAETPVAHDVRFLPTHLRKSHPLLSEDSIFSSSDSASKTGPRIRVIGQGMHSINNGNRDTHSTSGTTENSNRNRGRFRTSPSTTSTTGKSTEGTTSHSIPMTSTLPSVKKTASPTPFSPVGNMYAEDLGNLKITEIIYPTVAQKGSGLITSSSSTESATESGSSITASTTSSQRPSPVYDTNYDGRSPPLILMGSDSSVSELGIQTKGTMEGPPAFDDLLLEELIKGFEPPTTTHRPTTIKTTPSTTRTTTTTRPTTTTTRRTTTTTTTPRPTTRITTTKITTTKPSPKVQDDETSQLLQLLNLLQQSQQIPQTTEAITSTSPITVPGGGKLDEKLLKNLALLDTLLSPTAKTMIKEAVDAGTTEKIKAAKNPTGSGEGLSDADLKAIYMLLDAMSTTTTEKVTTTSTTPKPTMHPALQGMLTMLNNPWSDIQKLRAQQGAQPSQQTFSVPQPPKPVPTTSSLDLLSQLFNLNPQKSQTEKPKNADLGLGALFGSLIPKRTPANREATSGSNQLLNYFQAEQSVSPPPPGPYYWFDVNAFLGNDPNSGVMSGFRPKMGTRDYFLKVRRRRDSVERYY